MNVLSIDFDFFQDVTREQLINFYPDGHDLSTSFSELVWANHYSSDSEALGKIDILKNEFEILKFILLEQSHDCLVMIANSHKHIYDFIYDNYSGTGIRLVNVDMHHDLHNNNNQIDCGNWLSHIFEKQAELEDRFEFNWICNPASFDAFPLPKRCKYATTVKNSIRSSLNEIKEEYFDMIFLCRSDVWTAPHLDKYFAELVDIIKSNFDTIRIEKSVTVPRTEYASMAEQIKLVHKNALDSLQQKRRC